MFDLDINGHKKLNAKLNRMQVGVARKAVRPAMREALKPIESAAKQNAPVDTGRLRKYIKLFVKNSRRDGITGGVRTGTRKQMRIPDNSPYYYPAAVEFGSRKRSARAPLRRAMRSQRKNALRILGKGVAKNLRKL